MINKNLIENEHLSGIMNGVNRTFTTKHKFDKDHFQLHLNGLRLMEIQDYRIRESEGSRTGFDAVILRSHAPKGGKDYEEDGITYRTGDQLIANYLKGEV